MRRRSDALFVALAALHGALLLTVPSAPLVAIGIWWNSNTIAHNFIHRPFFRARWANQAFALCQSLMLGFPHTIYRERHLAHHREAAWHPQWSPQLGVEVAAIAGLWTGMLLAAPEFFALTYLPGYAGGLLIGAIHGYYEHAGAVTTSHYGRLYNGLCFNDGFHVEHHRHPGLHWTELPARAQPGAPTSRWPAFLRWIDGIGLASLEHVVLQSAALQRIVVAAHRRAFQKMLVDAGPIRRVAIIGGGLFPRTAIVLHDIAPDAELIVVDASARSLDVARAVVTRRDEQLQRAIRFRHERFAADGTSGIGHVDLVVLPLAYEGDREAVYARPPARIVLVHDWIWRVRGPGCVVSLWLLKRLNMVRG
jgi:hypothetical protein